jgi:hypothetical protein
MPLWRLVTGQKRPAEFVIDHIEAPIHSEIIPSSRGVTVKWCINAQMPGHEPMGVATIKQIRNYESGAWLRVPGVQLFFIVMCSINNIVFRFWW